ncbi:MAG: class I SAM-dependent methyltransferase [Chloroflexi bacterium]|nr:class I SAM-dependent methyltransferase [Chloroflexota bacterium]
MTIVQTGATVTPLEQKLDEVDSADLSAEWYAHAAKVLRGGDGGEHGLLLYKLVQRYANASRPVVVLDIGTARGFSAMTMARAMEDAGIAGHVHTVDIIDHQESLNWHAVKHEADDPLAGATVTRAEIWAKWFQEGGGITPITGRSADVLKKWDQGPINLAFLDGSHAYADVKRELTQLESLMDENGAIVVDDYHLGSTVVRIPSRLITAFAQRLRRVCEIAWPRMSKHVARFGAGNEYALVTYRLHGTRKAVAEFLAERPGQWSLEIIAMPSRGDYQGSDYSLAVLTRQQG